MDSWLQVVGECVKIFYDAALVLDVLWRLYNDMTSTHHGTQDQSVSLQVASIIFD